MLDHQSSEKTWARRRAVVLLAATAVACVHAACGSSGASVGGDAGGGAGGGAGDAGAGGEAGAGGDAAPGGDAAGNGGDASPDSGGEASTVDAPATSCSDTQSDPRNCGACGHDCLGSTTCAEGLCTPLKIAPSEVVDIALDSDNLYLATGSGVYGLAKAGGAPWLIADTAGDSGAMMTTWVMLDGSTLYFSASNNGTLVASVPASARGATGTLLVRSDSGDQMLPGGIYGGKLDLCGRCNDVFAIPVSAMGSATTIYNDVCVEYDLAFADDAASGYGFVLSSTNIIRRINLTTGANSTIALPAKTGLAMTVLGGRLYFVVEVDATTSALYTAMLDGTSMTRIGGTIPGVVDHMALDGTSAYLSYGTTFDSSGNALTESVARVTLATGVSVDVLGTVQGWGPVTALATDDSYLYLAPEFGGVYRVAK